MRRSGRALLISLAALLLTTAAQHTAAAIEITYPQDGTLFPPEIVAPTFTWQDTATGSDDWEIVAYDDQAREILRARASEPRWRPSPADWTRIKERSQERDVRVDVARRAPTGAPSPASVRIRTSKDPVGDALFYREVPLPFLSAVQDPSRIRWRFGTIDREDGPPIVLDNLPVCGNCHSFADDGSVLGLDVDYGNDKGAYGILPVEKQMVMDDAKIITWADYKREDGELTFGLLSRVSPTGRYVISTVKDRSVFVAMPDLLISQLFFPIKGVLVVYDRETKTFTNLPGADDPKFVQTNAVWSPDGKEIVFARAEAYRAKELEALNRVLVDERDVPEFTVEGKPFRYDLFRIPFNDGKGGKPEPLAGAAGDGKSNFFPKYSPDGKWIVFCKADKYMLLRPDSELYIVPAKGGAARRLRYNTARMNSWHSWSSNSRWLVFSSKVNTPYTQLFLTHIDEDGNDSPPVLLERFTSADRAANIPEFVRLPGNAIERIREQFLDPYSFLRAGIANERTGDYKGAERAYRRGLEIAPNDVELRNALGFTLFQDGRPAEAVPEYERAVAIDPRHAKAHNNLALALVELGKFAEAASHFRASLAIEPRAEIYSDLGFALARTGNTAEAMASYRKALEIDPECAAAHINLAVESIRASDFRGAEEHYRRAIASRDSAETRNGLGHVLLRQARTSEAIAEFRRALAFDADYLPSLMQLADTLARQEQWAEAAELYRRVVRLRPTAAAHNGLGIALRELGDKQGAEDHFDQAARLAAE